MHIFRYSADIITRHYQCLLIALIQRLFAATASSTAPTPCLVFYIVNVFKDCWVSITLSLVIKTHQWYIFISSWRGNTSNVIYYCSVALFLIGKCGRGRVASISRGSGSATGPRQLPRKCAMLWIWHSSQTVELKHPGLSRDAHWRQITFPPTWASTTGTWLPLTTLRTHPCIFCGNLGVLATCKSLGSTL